MEIGVYCTSIRPHLWSDLYKSLSRNNTNFNLCITGPCPPIEPLPGNVKYIQTNVKPPQCNFIAANNTKGDYILNVTDDIRYSDGALDNLLRVIVKESNTIVSCVFSDVGNAEGHSYLILERAWQREDKTAKTIKLNFPLPVCHLMKREDFNDIGIDKNFIATDWDLDMSFELVSRGGKIIVEENSFCTEEKGTAHLGCISATVGDYARVLNMWIENDKVKSSRKESINPLIYNDTVLTVSQGPKLDCWN